MSSAMSSIDAFLPYLPEHLPTLAKSTVLFFAIQSASYSLSPALFPKALHGSSRKERIEWASKTVGE